MDWGQRRLELALNDLLEKRPVREPELLEQLIALTAPRLPYTQISTKPSAVENIFSESLPSPQRVRLPIPTASSGLSTFWGSVRAPNAREQAAGKMAVYVDGDLLYVAFAPSIMRVIHRTRTELFGTTVAREVAAQNLRTAINGNMFDVSASGKIDIRVGHDPVTASATSPIGQVVTGGRVISGSSEPHRFYLAFNLSWAGPLPPLHGHPSFRFDMGNPPLGSGGADTALGGLGPIIIGGLRYGVGNLYRAGVPSGAPNTGPVSSTFRPFLVQRNNNTYAALQSRGAAVGKVVVAINRTEDMLLVLVQEDGGSSGMTLNTLRRKLMAIGCDDAVFGDGSDSVMLVVGGRAMIAQGSDKEEATAIGLGFT